MLTESVDVSLRLVVSGAGTSRSMINNGDDTKIIHVRQQTQSYIVWTAYLQRRMLIEVLRLFFFINVNADPRKGK